MSERTRGIVRALDPLGRICIPKEHRNQMGISEESSVEILLEERSGELVTVIKKADGVRTFKNELELMIQKIKDGCLAEAELEDRKREVLLRSLEAARDQL